MKNKRILPLRFLKAGRFERVSLTGNRHPNRDTWLSCATTPRIPAFQNLHGTKTLRNIRIYRPNIRAENFQLKKIYNLG